jgi:hypothetical protein
MSNQPQEQSYVDVKLLDCSRRASIEYISGNEANNAIFTNKLNSGIQLDVGDTINIHSAIVSERGAGGQTIELKGERIDNVSIKNITTATIYKEDTTYLSNGYRNSIINYDAITYNSSTFEKQLDDNQVHLTLQYYKTTNGENCFSLPRLFAYKTVNNMKDVYTANDCNEQGATMTKLTNGGFCESDYQRDRSRDSIYDDYRIRNNEISKIRQDGTKYTIFVRYGTSYINKDTTVPKIPDLTINCNANGSLDPAVAPYTNYRELKTITIPAGRRSADFIAEAFTQSLQNASNLDIYQYFKTENQPSGNTAYDNQGIISATYKTDTFKPFLCANGSTFSSSNFNEASTYDDNASIGQDSSIVSQERLDWINNFTFVAFKRPEFVESGRYHWLNNISYGGINYSYITHISDDKFGEGEYRRTTIEISQTYNDFNCQFLSNWLKTQELYPEFWNLRNASSPYHNRTEFEVQGLTTKTLTNASEDNILINGSALTLELPYQYVSKREITMTSASFTPNTVKVTNIVDTADDEQRIYFNGFTNSVINASVEIDFTITDTMVKPTIDNSRFLHLDMVQAYDNSSKTLAVDRKEFGSDMYYNASSLNEPEIIKYNSHSQPLFFTYIKEDENKFYANPQYNDNVKQLSYGAFLKGKNGNIMITTESLGGIAQEYYNSSVFFIGGEEAVQDGQYDNIKYKRHIGYDPHFTAYGNAAIGLWSPSVNPDRVDNFRVGLNTMNDEGEYNSSTDFDELGRLVNETYLGSAEPKLTYDTTKDRFGFTDFYTPEYLGNEGGAGDDSQDNPVRDGKAKVYKINKRLLRQNFAPGMGPYIVTEGQYVYKIDGTTQIKENFDIPNWNIYPMSIIDSHSGIAIESFGISEKKWERSLMGILGFGYDTLQAPISASNTMQQRVNTFNQSKLNKVTTQGEIKVGDTLIFNQNIYGAIMYKPNVFSSGGLLNASVPGSKMYTWNSPITLDTVSITLTGDSVPKSMLNPFFSIRSDLIDDTSAYFGSVDSGQNLPVMGIVLKNYNSGDYVYGEESSVQFTVTKPKVVTSITTSITDPDGSYSRVDDSSAVVYKIQKNKSYPINLLQELFGKK